MDINFLQQYTKTLQEAANRLTEMEKAGNKEGTKKILRYMVSLSKNVNTFIKNAQSKDK